MRGDCSPVFARDAKCHDAYGETHIASFQFNFTVIKEMRLSRVWCGDSRGGGAVDWLP